VTHGGCNHPEVVARIEQIAKSKKFPPARGDVLIQRHGHGRDFLDAWRHSSGLISLPDRYMHSPVEVVSLKDLEKIPETDGRLRAVA